MKVRRTRLATGLILLTYLSTHLINHSLGLISLQAMETGRIWFLALWRNPVGTVLLYGSLLTHFSLALWSLYQRRHLRIPLWEALQLTLGLSIPPLLSLHFVGTRMQHEWFGVEDSYSLLVLTLWHASPWDGVKQTVLITVAWLHGCIGLHFWLRLRAWYRRYVAIFLGCALLLPVLGLLGFTQAGHQVDNLIERDPDWIENVLRHAKVDTAGEDRAGPIRARQQNPHYVSRWTRGPRAAGLLGFGGEPLCWHRAYIYLWRSRPLLDLSDPHQRRPFQTAAAQPSGATSTAACRCATQRSSGLSIAARGEYFNYSTGSCSRAY